MPLKKGAVPLGLIDSAHGSAAGVAPRVAPPAAPQHPENEQCATPEGPNSYKTTKLVHQAAFLMAFTAELSNTLRHAVVDRTRAERFSLRRAACGQVCFSFSSGTDLASE